MSGQKVKFHIGNRYRRLPEKSAKKAGRRGPKRVHDWQLYVDVTSGNPDCIQSVQFNFWPSFKPPTAVCLRPVAIRGSNGSTHWRYLTAHQSYAPVDATISILFSDGRTKKFDHRVKFQRYGSRTKEKVYLNRSPPRMAIPEAQRYGIELELTSMKPLEDIRVAIRLHLGHSMDGWDLKHDRSIICSRNQPGCNTFELVSPILQGEEGLDRISQVIRALKYDDVDIKINKSMGFHVHVEVDDLSQHKLNQVCQNFVNFEGVFDSLVPPSRRSGSEESDRFFKSNANAVSWSSNRERHATIGNCRTIQELSDCMNPDEDPRKRRYHKLNLQNLITGKQPTLEFRQHSSTTDFAKISNWVRLCVRFVASTKHRNVPVKCFRDPRITLEVKTDALFRKLIQIPSVFHFYRKRQEELEHSDDDCCCNGCRLGGRCGQLAHSHGAK